MSQEWDGKSERRKATPESEQAKQQREQFRQTTATRLLSLEEGQKRQESALGNMETSLDSLVKAIMNTDDDSSQTQGQGNGSQPVEKLKPPDKPTQQDQDAAKQQARPKVRGLL